MIINKLPSAMATQVTVTSTAETLEDLIGVAISDPTYTFPINGAVELNAIDFVPEDGDIRYLMDGNIPTSAVGMPIIQGQFQVIRGESLKKLMLIAQAGDVKLSIQVGTANTSES